MFVFCHPIPYLSAATNETQKQDVDFDVFHKRSDDENDNDNDNDNDDKTRRARCLFSMLRRVTEEEGDGGRGSKDGGEGKSEREERQTTRQHPVGKIHVLHNSSDIALVLAAGRLLDASSSSSSSSSSASASASSVVLHRLGQRGAGLYTAGNSGHPNDWRDDRRSEILLGFLADHIVNVDCSPRRSRRKRKRGRTASKELSRYHHHHHYYDNKLHHEYQFDPFAVAYYSDPKSHRESTTG